VSLSIALTLEPTRDGAPAPPLRAAVEAAEAAGLEVESGPRWTTVSGGSEAVVAALDAIVRSALCAGATRLSLEVDLAAPSSPRLT
jgi:hypothetical protein